MFESETKLTVRYAETDQMGVVHHSNYPIWFEAGRTDFMKKSGLPYSQIEEKGFMIPLIELKCNYKGAAKYEDEIVVKTKISQITNTKLTFTYEVFRREVESPITTGETIHVWTNKELRPINFKKHAPEIFDFMSGLVGE